MEEPIIHFRRRRRRLSICPPLGKNVEWTRLVAVEEEAVKKLVVAAAAAALERRGSRNFYSWQRRKCPLEKFGRG